MSEYTISYCDCCLPDYFGGHHLPFVSCAVDGAMTLGQLKDDLKGYYAHGHLWEDERFIGGFDIDAYKRSVDSLFQGKNLDTVAFPDLEVPGEEGDWEGCYAYFVVECEYEDYETSQVVIPVDEYIVEASLDWVRHKGEWYLQDVNHFSCFLKGRELTEQRMWILPQGLKQKAISVIMAMKDELKTSLESETYGEMK
jgi:hypothetical protein